MQPETYPYLINAQTEVWISFEKMSKCRKGLSQCGIYSCHIKKKKKQRTLPAFPDTDHIAVVQTEVDNKNTFQF